MDATPTPAAPPQFSTLLGSTIEAILHELLYSRSIYPPDSFALYRHLGVRYHASRVPQVGDYIADFLRVAVAAIVSGVGDGLILIILEEDAITSGGKGDDDVSGERAERTAVTNMVERFVFQFQMDTVIGSQEEAEIEQTRQHNTAMDEEVRQQHFMNQDTDLAVEARSQLERSMRDCLLRVLQLRRRKRRKDERPENMSFKLCLHVSQDAKHPSRNKNIYGEQERHIDSCPELIRALNQGQWLQPEESSCLFSSATLNGSGAQQNKRKGLLRPIKDINLRSCGMTMQLGMEVCPF